MIPEPTKMNWSTVKPSLEEVVGKRVYVEWASGAHGSVDIKIEKDVEYFLGDDLVRYAIIDTEPDPLEYKGIKPEIREVDASNGSVFYFFWEDAIEIHSLNYKNSRADAIRDWNKFVRAMEEK